LDDGARNKLKVFGEFLEQHRPSGMLLMPELATHEDLLGLAWEYGCNSVRLGHEPDPDEIGLFACDERTAAADAVRRLATLSHTRIGLIAGQEDDPAMHTRELGYLDALADQGLDRGATLIASGDGSFESGVEAAQLLLDVSPAPTAIIACSDEMAAGAIAAASARKISVPQQLSIVGFGDTPVAAQLTPRLASVRVPFFEMASAATQRLLDPQAAISKAPSFQAKLVARTSMAPPIIRAV